MINVKGVFTVKWRKEGLIFEPKGQYDWVLSHASLPFAMHLERDRYRIYFGGRNKENKTQPGYIEVDIKNPKEILYISPEPVLKLGRPGLFDDSAVWPCWIIEHNNSLYMYYAGWMRGLSVPYYSAIGLAISEDGGKTFKKYSKAPIIDRNEIDPFSMSSSCVLIEDHIWKMWYLSVVNFRIENRKPMYCYHIKYAESKDGVHWVRKGIVCIDFKYPGETRIARPCVIKDCGIYKMWYSYAIGHGGYKIGYAESKDGIQWERKDEEVGIGVSKFGWDSEMICYPFVFEHKGQKYMLYNGNAYGKTGLGYAILEEE